MQHRIETVKYIGDRLTANGISVEQPTGGHSVYLNANSILPQIPMDQFPGQALSVALYIEGGIRSLEVGSVLFAGEN